MQINNKAVEPSLPRWLTAQDVANENMIFKAEYAAIIVALNLAGPYWQITDKTVGEIKSSATP